MRRKENMETWKRFSSGLLTPLNTLLSRKLQAMEAEYLEVKEIGAKLAAAQKALCRSKPTEPASKDPPKRLNRGVLKRRSSGQQADHPDGEKRGADTVDVVESNNHVDQRVERTDSYKTANEDELVHTRSSTSPPQEGNVSTVKPLQNDFAGNVGSVKRAVQAIEGKKLSKWDCLSAGLSVSVLYNKNELPRLRCTSASRKRPPLRRSRFNVSQSSRIANPLRPLPSSQSMLGHTRLKMLSNKENIGKTAPKSVHPALKASKILCTKIEPKSASATTPIKRNYIFTDNELTPPRRKGQMKNENDYGIDELASGDSTDDEECPRKQRPPWACGETLLEQVKLMPPYSDTFKVFPAVNLSEIFCDHPLPIRTRTSSANWHSFHRTLAEEQSVVENGN